MTEATKYRGPIAETLREFDDLAKRHEKAMEALKAVDERAIDERYGIQADRLSTIAAITYAALNAEREATR